MKSTRVTIHYRQIDFYTSEKTGRMLCMPEVETITLTAANENQAISFFIGLKIGVIVHHDIAS